MTVYKNTNRSKSFLPWELVGLIYTRACDRAMHEAAVGQVEQFVDPLLDLRFLQAVMTHPG